MNDSSPTPDPDGGDLNAMASVRMETGIVLLNAGAPDAIHKAIRCFEEAIDLRSRLPLEKNPGFRYGLAAGWINRGDALTRLGVPENLVEAVNSYTTAIELLKDPPATDNGAFVRRLAIAWMNRGIALEEQKSEPALAEAVHSYENAVTLLSDPHRAMDAANNLALASAWINLGNALLRTAGNEPAERICKAARNALSLLAETESKERAAADAALKARHVLCQALTVLLAAPSEDPSIEMDFIGKMTDAAEDALRLAQHWEKAGETCFRPLAIQFFQLAVLAYEKYQPHFLAEFLLEHLDTERAACFPAVSESWLAIGKESISRVRRGVLKRSFLWLATPQGIRELETLRTVQAAEARLKIQGSTPN